MEVSRTEDPDSDAEDGFVPRPSPLSLVLLVLLDSTFWALTGGLGWGSGLGLATMLGLPDQAVVLGGVGVGLVALALLTVRDDDEDSQYAPFVLAVLGGMVVGGVTLAVATGSPKLFAIGGAAGFVLSLTTTVHRQGFPASGYPVAIGVAVVVGSAVVAVVTTVEGPLNGALAGGVAMLVCVVLLPPPGPGNLSGRLAASLNPLNPFDARVLKGALAGWTITLWGDWTSASEQRPRYFVYAAALAGLLVLASRAGLAGRPRPVRGNERSETGDEESTAPPDGGGDP